VESDDIVDPGDAALQAPLALTAENIHGDEGREKLIDAILTISPLAAWPSECREKLRETCEVVSVSAATSDEGPRYEVACRRGVSHR